MTKRKKRKHVSITGCPRCGKLWGKQSGLTRCTGCGYTPQTQGVVGADHYEATTWGQRTVPPDQTERAISETRRDADRRYLLPIDKVIK